MLKWLKFAIAAALVLAGLSIVSIKSYESYLLTQIGHANPPEAPATVIVEAPVETVKGGVQ